MPVSKKQQASVNKYIKENYDTFRLTFPKGKKANLQAHADQRGESLNGFVNRAIDEAVERDNRYRLFTEADARRLDLQKLLTDIVYQLDIADTFGTDVLAAFLEKARRQ